MKVLLILPPYLDLYGRSKISVQPYFPLGLGYIATALKHAGNEVSLIADAKGTFLSSVIAAIEDFSPDIIGFSSMTTNYPNAVETAREIKKKYSIPIVIGGHHVSAYKDKILKEQQEFDFVVYGEGEETVVELVECLSHNIKDLSGIKGLIWRNDKEILTNHPRPLETNLDRIPFPARELVDLSKFSVHSHVAEGKSATIITSRGCPFNCNFCSAHLVEGRRYRAHSVNYVLSEIEMLINKYNIRNIVIQDDTFTFDRNRVEEICREIIKRKLNFKFGCLSRVDVMDEALAGLLKRAGCNIVMFGIESGDKEVLKKMKKGATIEKARYAIQACNKVGLKSFASFVIGFPSDTGESMQRTIDFAIELKPTLVAFNPLVPFPGADIFDETIHTPATIDGWKKYLTVDVPPFSFVKGLTTEDIYKIVQRGHRQFYLRPGQIWKIITSIRSLIELKGYIKSGLAVMFR